jgi:hypothetical protein
MPEALNFRNVPQSVPYIFLNQVLQSPDPMWPDWNPIRLNQALEASLALVEEHGDRFFAKQGVDDDADFPYIRFECVNIAGRGTQNDVEKTVVTRKAARCTICSVRRFPAGQGSPIPFDKATQAFMDCATGIGYTKVYGVQGEFLGHVTSSSWLDDYEHSYTNEDTGELIIEMGIVIELVYG